MLFGLITRRRLTTLKMRYARGSSWIGYFPDAGHHHREPEAVRAVHRQPAAVVAADAGGHRRRPSRSYFVACYLIGWIDERKGIWKNENTYGWEVSPESMELIATVRMMREYIEEQRARENTAQNEIPAK